MREAIWALYWHMQSTDEDHKHNLCPRGNEPWCKYLKAVVNKQVYVHKTPLPQVVMQAIKPNFHSLAKTELLEKRLHGKPQNPNESVNNVIRSKLPNTVFVGLNTLHSRV